MGASVVHSYRALPNIIREYFKAGLPLRPMGRWGLFFPLRRRIGVKISLLKAELSVDEQVVSP